MGAARGTSRHASSTEQLSTALLSPSPEAASAPQKCAVTKDTTYCSYLGSLVTKLNRVARMPKLIIKSAKAKMSGQKQQHKAKIEVHPVRVSPEAVARLMPIIRTITSIIWMVDSIFFRPWFFGFSLINPLWLLRRWLQPEQIRRRALKLSGLPVEQYHLPVQQIDSRIQTIIDAVVDNKGTIEGCVQKTGGNMRVSLLSVMMLEGQIMKQLVADLHVSAARTLTPRVDAAFTGAPLIIAALPRSGTTLLLELLSCDKTTWRQLTSLEANMPCFVGQNGAARRRYEKYAEEFCAGFQNYAEDLKHIHYEHWAGPTECRDALANGCGASYRFWEFFGLAEPMNAWLENDAERHKDYVRYRTQLGAIKVANGTNQDNHCEWLLKDPCHLFSLDALFSVFPNASVVMLHRDPATISVSLCSLNSAVWNSHYRKEPGTGAFKFKQSGVDVLAKLCDSGLDYRERNPDAKIHDLTMRALVDDPIAAVEGIYKFAGKTLSATARTAMLEYLRVNKREKRSGRHSYSAADFGLDVNELNSRFARYKAKFGV